MNSEDVKQGFKVTDKRRFDAQGDERADAASARSEDKPASRIVPVPPGPSRPAASEPKTVESTMGAEHEPSGDDGLEITFSSFIVSLATQALMQLGHIKPPPGVAVTVDKVAAKQTIDILSMLDLKTKNNRDAEENRLLEEVLHSLRMAFVKVA